VVSWLAGQQAYVGGPWVTLPVASHVYSGCWYLILTLRIPLLHYSAAVAAALLRRCLRHYLLVHHRWALPVAEVLSLLLETKSREQLDLCHTLLLDRLRLDPLVYRDVDVVGGIYCCPP